MTEDRKEPRLYVISYVKVSEGKSDRAVGRVLDMTTRGMRLRSKEPVDVNTSARFRLMLPVEPHHSREITFEADIIWCRKTESFDCWDTGIQLQDIPTEDAELIEQFVSESSFEDRWLALARCFPHDN